MHTYLAQVRMYYPTDLEAAFDTRGPIVKICIHDISTEQQVTPGTAVHGQISSTINRKGMTNP